MKNFDYFAPKSLKEAIALLSKNCGKAKLMAGGTDLIVEMRNGELQPERVIDLKHIPNLDRIDYIDGEGLVIGALVKIRSIETSTIIREKFNLLTQAAAVLGSIQVRNKATIGGNLCQAAPSGDMAPALIALDAVVRFVGKDGTKSVPLDEFFEGPGKTVLQEDEILTELTVPDMAPFSEGVYLKFTPRRAMDLALVGIVTVLTMDFRFSNCLDARIVLGGVAPTPIRAKKAERLIKGAKIDGSIMTEAARIASNEAKPSRRLSARASDWYRRQIIKVLVKRSIHQAVGKLKAKATGGRQL